MLGLLGLLVWAGLVSDELAGMGGIVQLDWMSGLDYSLLAGERKWG